MYIEIDKDSYCTGNYVSIGVCPPNYIEYGGDYPTSWSKAYKYIGGKLELDSNRLKQLQNQNETDSKIEELELYLTSTDWYAIRYADTGEPIPDDIKKKRQMARDEISRLKNL